MSADLLGAFSQMLDDSYPATDARTAQEWRDEAIMWRRSMKGTEEAGEVTEAVLGLLGENPRKGQTHTLAEVISEHLDAAMAHLGSVEHLTGNKGEALDLLDAHIADRHERLSKAIGTAPPEVSE